VTGSLAPALAPADEPTRALAAVGRNCRTTAYSVPSERGGMSTVRVTRCYPNEE